MRTSYLFPSERFIPRRHDRPVSSGRWARPPLFASRSYILLPSLTLSRPCPSPAVHGFNSFLSHFPLVLDKRQKINYQRGTKSDRFFRNVGIFTYILSYVLSGNTVSFFFFNLQSPLSILFLLSDFFSTYTIPTIKDCNGAAPWLTVLYKGYANHISVSQSMWDWQTPWEGDAPASQQDQLPNTASELQEHRRRSFPFISFPSFFTLILVQPFVTLLCPSHFPFTYPLPLTLRGTLNSFGVAA